MADDLRGEGGEFPEDAAYRWVLESPRKITATTLESRLIRYFRMPRADGRRVIRALVVDGRLAYVYLYGQSYIDLGFRCPTPITRRVILYPPVAKNHPSPIK